MQQKSSESCARIAAKEDFSNLGTSGKLNHLFAWEEPFMLGNRDSQRSLFKAQNSPKYSIVGLGKLGCSMAAAIAGRGFGVIGVDAVPEVVEKVNAAQAPVIETDLEKTIAANRERLRATTDYREALLDSDVTFVAVPTPSDERGAFSLEHAGGAFREIGKVLAEKQQYHLVVLTSTVLPGSTRYGLLPVLERESGKTCGRDFGLCYSPEFIALGSVIRDFLNPDFVLIGEGDERAGSLLEACYAQILENHAPCKRMSFENAELAKIALNSFVTMKITFANMLAELCQQIPGGNVDVVSDALGMDSRIGRKYLTGAIGYGGPCFPRDNIAFEFMARALSCNAPLARTTDQMNRTLVGGLVELLRPYLRPGATVAVLGLAYKPLSHVVEDSQGLQLSKELSRAGIRVVGFDPLATDEAQRALRDHDVVIVRDIESCISQADAVVITTPDPVFRALHAADFPRKNPPIVVLDCWRILGEELSAGDHVRYVPLGIGPHEPALAARLKAMWYKDVEETAAARAG
jgi:UDPglucose 6-dehydrogenase